MLSVQETIALQNMERDNAQDGLGARRRAARQYRQARAQAERRKLLAALFHRKNHLEDLDEVLQEAQVKGRYELGRQSVPLAKIVGTQNRADDFDAGFYPLQSHNEQRWIGVAEAYQMGVILPPVELIQVGQNYFVRDGHHRISLARLLGQSEIEAQVVLWQLNP